tara:strand:- start:18548 stop:18889 length:342 start_codon:yes stop_codon:yes gene_type:complete
MSDTPQPASKPDPLWQPGDAPTGPRLCKETCPELDVADDEEMREYWLNRFEYHPPIGDQGKRYGRIRAAGRAMVELILDLAPDSPERTRALEHLQDVTMLTNAAIACNENAAA